MKKSLIWDFGDELAREPIIRRMPGGNLVCTFLTGGPREPNKKNAVLMSGSSDDGETWSTPKTVISHSKRGCWATEIFTEGARPMMVVHTYKNTDIMYRELQTFRSYALDDAGDKWSEPVSFPWGLNGVSVRQGIVMSNGEWLFPVYWQETTRNFDWEKQPMGGPGESWPFRAGVAVSPDGGNSYARYGYICGTHSLWENNCIELERGHIVMLMRDNSRPYLKRADSFDFGRTWSEPANTAIPNPNTKLSLVKIEGRVYLISNFSEGFGWEARRGLEIRRANADMTEFAPGLAIEPANERYFYPHAYADARRRVLYVAYENGHAHKLARVRFEELPQG